MLDEGSGYEPKFTLVEIIVLVVSVVNNLWDPSLGKKKKKKLFNALFRKIEGNHDDDIDCVFPFTRSSDPTISNHNYIEGTNFPLLLQQCPSSMEPVVSLLKQNPAHSGSQMAEESVAMGYVDGDGSLHALHSGNDIPRLDYGIKDSKRHKAVGDDPNAYKMYLVDNCAGFYHVDTDANATSIRRNLNRETFCGSLFFIAATFCLTIKAPNFMALCNLSVLLRLMSPSTSRFVRFCRRMFSHLLSGLNIAHGVGLGRAYYDHRFQMMAQSKVRGLLNYHGAGMLGSDGCILVDQISIGQSNKEYLEAFRDICQSELGFQHTEVSSPSGDLDSVNSRGKWVLTFKKDDRARAVVHFGAFDYNRRTQWLIHVITRIIQNTDLPNKKSVVNFLTEFMSYVKEVRPS